jgi:hypothetical protein
MHLSAFASLGRGLASLRANWGLVWLQWLQVLLLWALTIGGLLLPLSVLGFDLATSLAFLVEGEPPPLTGELERQLENVTPALLAALVGACAVWTLGFFVYCWFQAGTYGVLIAADRQAAPGARDRRLFRTFSHRDFAGWAGRYLWRYFWLVNLFVLFATPVLVLALLWLVLLGVGVERWGMSAAVGFGCGGALPLGFLVVVLTLGMWLAMADAAREGSGVWTATRHGLRVLGRRLGASTLLAVLVGAMMGLELATVLLLGFVIERVTPEGTAAQVAAVLGLNAGHWLVAAVVGVFTSAAAVALVQAELRAEPPAALRGKAAA